MAETPKKITRLKKFRSSCFLCCFAFSRKEKISEKISSVKLPSNIEKETTGSFSWSMFRMKNKNSSSKTVPLDTSDRSTDLSESKIRSSKSSSNFKSKWKIQKLFTKRMDSTTKAMPFREVTTTVKEIIEETTQGPEQNKTQADTSKNATCRKRLTFSRKRDAVRTGSSQPGSTDIDVKPNPKPARTKRAATLSYSVSMPVPARENRTNPLYSKARFVPKVTRQDDNVTVNKFDPVVGMSIIVVTLIIMLIWGRFCAVLCTSAWLYFVPRLRALKNDNDADDAAMKINGDVDLNSEECKRRVVLEGFLDRDHRAVTAAVL